MLEMGTLVDANGVALTDLSSITFAETLTTGFTKVVDAINHLAQAMGYGLPAAAQQAADGMNRAFSGVRGPNIQMSRDDAQTWLDNRTSPDIGEADMPHMARGGYVPARSGGTVVKLGEGGEGEYVIPESKMGGSGGGGGSREVVLVLNEEVIGRVMLPLVVREAQRLGVS
jgi:hypothetical protein